MVLEDREEFQAASRTPGGNRRFSTMTPLGSGKTPPFRRGHPHRPTRAHMHTCTPTRTLPIHAHTPIHTCARTCRQRSSVSEASNDRQPPMMSRTNTLGDDPTDEDEAAQ